MPDLRMPEINRVFLAGRLTREPDLHYTPQGTPVCDINIACSRRITPKDGGEAREETYWAQVECWGAVATYAGENLKKGWAVLVEGRLKHHEQHVRGGAKQTHTRVVAFRVQALQWPDKAELQHLAGGQNVHKRDINERPPKSNEPDDDIPF